MIALEIIGGLVVAVLIIYGLNQVLKPPQSK